MAERSRGQETGRYARDGADSGLLCGFWVLQDVMASGAGTGIDGSSEWEPGRHKYMSGRDHG